MTKRTCRLNKRFQQVDSPSHLTTVLSYTTEQPHIRTINFDWSRRFWTKTNRQASYRACHYRPVNLFHSCNRIFLESRWITPSSGMWIATVKKKRFKHAPCAYVAVLLFIKAFYFQLVPSWNFSEIIMYHHKRLTE